MTPVLCCGFECGVAGTHGATVGWTLNNTGAFSTTQKRTGARALRANPSASTNAYHGANVVLASSNKWILRVYVYFDVSLPNQDTLIIGTNSTGIPGAWFKASDSKIYAGYNSSGLQAGASGVSVTTGQWYRIDVAVDSSANPWTIDVQVNGTACGQKTNAATAALATLISCALINPITALTADVYWDDVIMSNAVADYPIGAGHVHHFVPTSDGTHNVAGTGDFQRGDTGVDILNATTTAYQLVDDIPLPSGTVVQADCIRAVAPPNDSDYVQVLMGPAPDVPTPTSAPRWVEWLVVTHQIGTQTGASTTRLQDPSNMGNLGEILAANSGSGVTTYQYTRATLNGDPPGTATSWNIGPGDISGNFLRSFINFYAADAAPDQCLDAVMAEAEFVDAIVAPSFPSPRHGYRMTPHLQM